MSLFVRSTANRFALLRCECSFIMFVAFINCFTFISAHHATAARRANEASDSPAAEAAKIAKLLRVPESERGLIQLPIRFHIITNLELVQKDVKMSTWVTTKEVKHIILPEINRIWRPAGIVWALESVVERPAKKIANHDEGIQAIVNAKRGVGDTADTKRLPFIYAFCDRESGHKTVNNVYLFPYMGQTMQGVASFGGNQAFVGVWTDKPSRGAKPPQKSLLRERLPFKIGSIARTCSHELGHNLMLSHPAKDAAPQKNKSRSKSKSGRLMGGSRHGYELSLEEMLKSREAAMFRGKRILEWVAKQGGG